MIAVYTATSLVKGEGVACRTIRKTYGDERQYPLQAGTFRLYYTPLTSGSHTIETTLKSNAGRVEHLVLNFNAPSKGGGSTLPTLKVM